jgi:Kef-type K+ transport system membrane component KefB
MSQGSMGTAIAVHRTEALLFVTLLQLTVIVVAGRLGGFVATRLGQSAAVGEIIVGILLGPSLLGWIAPETFAFVFHSVAPEPLQILSSLGLVLLMFQIGLDFDFSHLSERANRDAVVAVATACLVLPFALGLGYGYSIAPVLSPGAVRVYSALFVATAFSITALPILGRIMIELNITRTRLGVIAISAAAINDVVGWLLLALITALTVSRFDAWAFLARVAGVCTFGLACIFLVRPFLRRAIHRARQSNVVLSANLLGGLLATIFLAAIATYLLGIFAIFGGFIIGVILFDEVELVQAWRERVGGFVTVFFLPIFFTYTGLRTSIGGLDSASAWGYCLAVIALATVGKFGGAYVAARYSGLGHPEAMILGFMMNTRALMELVVINVGLDLGVISHEMFTMLVLMAIVSTVITTPALRFYLTRIPAAHTAAA